MITTCLSILLAYYHNSYDIDARKGIIHAALLLYVYYTQQLTPLNCHILYTIKIYLHLLLLENTHCKHTTTTTPLTTLLLFPDTFQNTTILVGETVSYYLTNILPHTMLTGKQANQDFSSLILQTALSVSPSPFESISSNRSATKANQVSPPSLSLSFSLSHSLSTSSKNKPLVLPMHLILLPWQSCCCCNIAANAGRR